jgi:hypothetical protein
MPCLTEELPRRGISCSVELFLAAIALQHNVSLIEKNPTVTWTATAEISNIVFLYLQFAKDQVGS